MDTKTDQPRSTRSTRRISHEEHEGHEGSRSVPFRQPFLTFVIVVTFVATVFVPSVAPARAQGDPTDADLEAASAGRVIRVGALATDGHVTVMPLEVYVARVLAGEGEPRAADAAQQALAIAIRTYALANLDRHG